MKIQFGNALMPTFLCNAPNCHDVRSLYLSILSILSCILIFFNDTWAPFQNDIGDWGYHNMFIHNVNEICCKTIMIGIPTIDM